MGELVFIFWNLFGSESCEGQFLEFVLRAIDRGFQSLGIPVIFILFYRIYYVFRTTRRRSHLLVFEERGISENPGGEKPLGAEERRNKLIPHLPPRLGNEPGPHWWEAIDPHLCVIPVPCFLKP